ncbi:MAG: hypothetical protein AAFW89_08000 [Bacteroidota bacterium]
MKKTLSLLVFTLILGFASTSLYAQSANVAGTANVLADIALTVQDSVQFGDIPTSTSSVIDPNGNTATNAVGGTQAAGLVEVAGAPNQTLAITFGNGTLSDGSGNSFTLTTTAAGDPNSANQASAAEFASGAGSHTTDGSGNYYIWLGGSITTPATSGAYSTSNTGGTAISVSVSYN